VTIDVETKTWENLDKFISINHGAANSVIWENPPELFSRCEDSSAVLQLTRTTEQTGKARTLIAVSGARTSIDPIKATFDKT